MNGVEEYSINSELIWSSILASRMAFEILLQDILKKKVEIKIFRNDILTRKIDLLSFFMSEKNTQFKFLQL